MGHLLLHRQQANGTVAVFCEDPLDPDIGDVSGRAFIGIHRHQVVITGPLEVFNDAVMATVVEIDAVNSSVMGLPKLKSKMVFSAVK